MMIYLDYAANTPADADALNVFLDCEQRYIANPNANHPLGLAAREQMAQVTDAIAQTLNVEASGLIYTSGATEANNTVLKGIAEAYRPYGHHILTTPLEHPSISETLAFLKTKGFEIELLNLKEDGTVDLDDLSKRIKKETILITVPAVDSELGIVQPIQKIAELKQKSEHCKLHVDATQAIGKCPICFDGLDSASLTAHKFYGLNGIGILYKARNTELCPLIHGGSGASPFRSGTPTLALAASLNVSLQKAFESLQPRVQTVQALNARLRSALASYPRVRFNSPPNAVPHILNLSVSGIKATRFRQSLSDHGVCISVQTACQTDGGASKSVLALSHDHQNALSSFRISLSHLTTDEEIDQFLTAFDRCYQKLFH